MADELNLPLNEHLVIKTKNFTCFSDISSDKTLEEERILMAVSSSKIFP